MSSKRHKQLSFFKNKSIYASWKQLGGSKMTSHPKRRRPISTRDEVHMVLKAARAAGRLSMRAPQNIIFIEKHVYSLVKKLRIKIARFENVGNHLHLLLKVPSHGAYNAFSRGVTSSIARHVLGVSKSNPYGDGQISFWAARPFTRIVTWGKDRLGLLKYLSGNRIAAVGFDQFIEEESIGYRLTG